MKGEILNKILITVLLVFHCVSFSQQNNEWIPFLSSVNSTREMTFYNNSLWIATGGGLFKYDINSGLSVKYDRTNTNLPFYTINNLIKDNQGNLWLGTNDIIIKYDGNTFTKFRATDLGMSGSVSLVKIRIDNQGSVWFGFAGGGFLKFNGTNWQVFTLNNIGITTSSMTDFDIDNNGSLWIATYGYFLFKYDGSTTTVYDYTNSGIISQNIKSVVIDNQNNKWIGTPIGLQKFDDQNWITFNTFNSGLTSNYISKLRLDNQYNLWISTLFPGAVVKYNGTSWQVFDNTNSPIDGLYSYTNDSIGNMWFANDGKVFKLQNNNWVQLNNYTDFKSYSVVTSFAQDSLGNYWFGTYFSGLIKFDGTNWQDFNTSNSGLPSNFIRGLSYNSQSGLWIATADSGIVNFDGNNWVKYNSSNSPLVSDQTTAIVVDNNNKKWIGTYSSGIQYISSNMNQWINFTSNNSGLLNDYIKYLDFDNNVGKLWVINGNFSVIPQSFDGLIWKSYDTLANYSNVLWDICFDNQNNVWFGTGNSLAKFKNNEWTFYNSFNSGLPINGQVSSISKDLDGSIWLVNQDLGNISYVNFDGSNWLNLNFEDYPLISNWEFQVVKVDKWGNKWFFADPRRGTSTFLALVYKQGGVVLSADEQIKSQRFNLDNFRLEQNYPNPFNPSTKIRFTVPDVGTGFAQTVLKVYDILGNEVATLVNEEKPAGVYEVEFNVAQVSRPELASGIYFYQLRAGSFVETKKMTLIK
uniref:T9SS type A sorting domain-containing protein n=1 Tax=Ignavibacterium album TaxID=591197 RepID=A0A832DF66_9BACT